jgi:hypothetical protein
MRKIDFPPEWVDGDPVDAMSVKCGGRDDVVLVSVLLDSGTGLWTLIYPGGVRFMRASGSDVPAVREDGEPEPEVRDLVEGAWAELLRLDLESAAAAALEVDAIERRN